MRFEIRGDGDYGLPQPLRGFAMTGGENSPNLPRACHSEERSDGGIRVLLKTETYAPNIFFNRRAAAFSSFLE